MSHCLVCGFWLLPHYQYWILMGTFLRYSVVALCPRNLVAYVLQDWLPNVL